MNIGIVGSGKIGSVVGKLWARAGHQVRFSSRHADGEVRPAAMSTTALITGATRGLRFETARQPPRRQLHVV
jgi:predicted dinucleotide-binding enzyme